MSPRNYEFKCTHDTRSHIVEEGLNLLMCKHICVGKVSGKCNIPTYYYGLLLVLVAVQNYQSMLPAKNII